MTLLGKVKRTLEVTLLAGAIAGGFYAPIGIAELDRMYYNSLSKEDKITYLQNISKVVNSHKLHPAPNKFGAAIVLSYDISNKAIQKELQRLKGGSD